MVVRGVLRDVDTGAARGCACYGVVKLSLTCGDGWRGTAVDPGPICLMNTSVGDCLAEDDDRGGE